VPNRPVINTAKTILSWEFLVSAVTGQEAST
jgi:hypothetical protein